MQKFTYSPPKIKDSTKMVNVFNEQGNIVCKFKRTYKNLIVRLINYWRSFDWYAQIDAYSIDGELIYQCKKTTKLIRNPEYQVINCKTNEEYQITYKSWQKVVPEFLVTSPSIEFIIRKEIMDWVRIYYEGKEVARWKRKTTELFKTYLEIEEDCPIQQPEFFICLFQNIFYIGD